MEEDLFSALKEVSKANGMWLELACKSQKEADNFKQISTHLSEQLAKCALDLKKHIEENISLKKLLREHEIGFTVKG
jgi:hypothetical protein